MTKQESEIQAKRIFRFNELTEERNRCYKIMGQIHSEDQTGPHGQGPFTGNTRESRSISTLAIGFTPTVGGGAAVSLKLESLNIKAYEFGVWLSGKLNEQIKKIDEDIKAL